MKLSDLKTGDTGIVIKVGGQGNFRKRLIEMGFIPGKKVSAVMNAPLKDPIEYEILGYKVSLRRAEAALIDISSEEDYNSEKAGTIRVALVGNPNCGKTSLFNMASGSHEHVGNYSGVTVDAKEGHFTWKGRRLIFVDLPGTYSLSAFSPEEKYVRENLVTNVPDVVINVVDASNLERNLYLTTQVKDMNLKVVMALNMYDELKKRGDRIDTKWLGKLLGMPVCPTVCRTGEGVPELLDTVLEVADSESSGEPVSVDKIIAGEDSSEIEKRYQLIHDVLSRTYVRHIEPVGEKSWTEKIDSVVTNKWAAFPIFILLLYIIFQATFSLGEYPMNWIDWLVGKFGGFVGDFMKEGWLKDVIVDGIIAGVGSVLVFLPNILILYLFLSIMEDTGYMARAAFIMDKLMHRIGLHGKSFIPMVMGFGCNVPAIMATRAIESRKSRLITIAIIPFMSCAGRLPIFVLLAGAFFPHNSALALLGIYFIGVLLAIFSALILSRFIKDDDLPFVMELPPYRVPTAKATWRHTWEKGKQYLEKMATTILIGSVVIWCLGYFPRSHKDAEYQQEHSYIGQIGKAVSPALEPLGFNWKMDISLLSGVVAKELVVSTLGVMYAGDEPTGDPDNTQLQSVLASSVSLPAAVAFMLFILLYFPCIATFVAIKNETGKWGWAIAVCAYTMVVAWVCAFIGFHITALLI
ncbi:MAG: ferrous iron transport protein B [Bacteroidales bacterium]|nr:ferrous iron transport protein B [Bacteroidales bacterium]